MTLHVFDDLEQGSEEWLAARRGIVTASVVGRLLTPTLAVANNDTSRGLTAQLVAERITGWTEDTYVNADMERGNLDEPVARGAYAQHVGARVDLCGFMRRDESWGSLGFSPDGLVGNDGFIEIKSRRPKKQVQTVLADEIPSENVAQIQAGFLVSGRSWCDYVSFAGGLHLYVKRIYPSPAWQAALVDAVQAFEVTAARMQAAYEVAVQGLPMTERTNDLGLVF